MKIVGVYRYKEDSGKTVLVEKLVEGLKPSEG